MLRAAFVVMVLLAVPLLAAPVPKALKAKATLNGRWELVEQNSSGRNDANFNKWMWVIDGEELTYRRPDREGVYQPSEVGTPSKLTRVPEGRAEEIDWHYGTRTVYKAVAVQDGDDLVVCYPSGADQGTRPTEAKAGVGVQLFRFKRVTDK